MSYKLIKENDDYFEIEHEKDGSFVIAKKALDDQMIGKIHKMFGGGRVGYADGGVVEAPSLYSQTDTDFSIRTPQGEIQTFQKNFDDPNTLSLYNKASQQAEKEVESFQKKTMVEQPTPQKIETPSIQTPVQEQASVQETKPMMPGYLESTKKMLQPTAPQTTATPPAESPYVKAYDDSYKRMQAAQMGMAQAQKEAQEQNVKDYQKQEEELARIQSNYQTSINNLTAESENLQKSYMSGKIDPNRVWSNMSTGNRILAGISVLLGGLGQGLSGSKTNPAWDVLNDAIDRDIDAQKANLGKTSSLLSFNMQKLGNLNAALAATRVNLIDLTQAQINKTAAKLGSKTAIAQAQISNEMLNQEKAKLMQSIAAQQQVQGIIQAPGGIPKEQVLRLPEEQRKTLVMMDNGNYYQAINEKGADAVSKAQELLTPVQNVFNQAKEFMDTEGRMFPGESAKGKADVLQGQMVLAVKNLENLGILSKDDTELVNKMIPQLSDLTFRGKDKEKINTLINFVDNKKNMFYQKYIPNYTPAQIKQIKIQ